MLSVFLVCFDSRNEGRLFSPHLKKEVAFSTLPDFLLMADRCCERVAISQRSTERSTVGKQLIEKSDSKQNISFYYSPMLIRAKGKTATFLMTVSFRHNASWQGSVRWIEGQKHEKFRSVFELLRIFYNAFSYDAGETANIDATLDSAFIDFK